MNVKSEDVTPEISFADFVITAAKRSVKGRKLDGALKSAFGNLRRLTDQMGLARTATVFKHIDDPADLASLAAVAQKNADAAYFTVKHGGADGVGIIKRLGDSDMGVTRMAQAAKKGPAGIPWLKRGGAGHPYVVRVRVGARILKNLRMERPQQLITELAKQHPGLRKALWAGTILAFLSACFSLVESGRKFYDVKKRLPPGNHIEKTAQPSGSRDGVPAARDS